MRKHPKIYYWYAALIALYLLISLLPAPDHVTLVKYHVGPGQLRLIDVTLFLPLFAIWLAAFYGYQKLQHYAQSIRNTKDGRGVRYIARGLLVFALGLPLSSILGGIFNIISNHYPSFHTAATVISNYMTILYVLIAFSYVGIGTRRLSALTKRRPTYLQTNAIAGLLIVLGVTLCDLIARSHQDIREAYHMSYHLVMFTIAIPYMYIWFIGLLAVTELYIYSKSVAGVVYRKSWGLLALGLGSLILVDITLQYLSTLSSWLNNLSLPYLLLLLYILLIALAATFIVVALGTKRLMKIEEV